MSAHWPVADPDSKRTCGHRRCSKSTWAAVGLFIAAGALVASAVTYGYAHPFAAWLAPVTEAGVALGVCGLVAACWPHPRDDGLEALIEATREDLPDHVPAEWVEEFS